MGRDRGVGASVRLTHDGDANAMELLDRHARRFRFWHCRDPVLTIIDRIGQHPAAVWLLLTILGTVLFGFGVRAGILYDRSF